MTKVQQQVQEFKLVKEPDLYQHIRTVARLQQYFPSGTGDHFPFGKYSRKESKGYFRYI